MKYVTLVLMSLSVLATGNLSAYAVAFRMDDPHPLQRVRDIAADEIAAEPQSEVNRTALEKSGRESMKDHCSERRTDT